MDRVRREQTLQIHPDSAFPLVVRAVKGRRRFHVTSVHPETRAIDFTVLFSMWKFLIPSRVYASNSEAWVTVEPGAAGGSVITFTSEPADDWFAISFNWVNGRAAARRFFKDLRKAVAGLTGGPTEPPPT